MSRKKKSRIQICDKCGAPYISAEKHAQSCHGGPTHRGLKELCEWCGAWYFHLEGHVCSEKPSEHPPALDDNRGENFTASENFIPPNTSAAVIIARRHQSAPKEHWADREMRDAAQEIVDGKVEGSGPGDDFFAYGETQTVLSHPRVQEALRRMETELEEVRHTQELLEKTQMYHEYNANLARKNQWDGQGRWAGKENEEMRRGELLTPQEFMRRLLAVVPNRGLELNSFAVLKRVAILIPDPNANAHSRLVVPSKTEQQIEILRSFERELATTIDPRKQLRLIDNVLAAQSIAATAIPDSLKGKMQVATLQYPLSTEWMVMKFDEYGVPTHAKYLGWRTALLTLITQGIVTEKEAHRAFPLGSGPAGDWYREQLFMLRNRGVVAS